jgi:cellulose biosynthesis protein BcsQ
MDPQANLTSGVGLKGQSGEAGTIYDALMDEQSDARPLDFVVRTAIDHLSLIPADRNLTGAEIELVTAPNREHRLRRIVDALRSEFDVIFIDSPPSLGLLTLNALVAADSVLVPLNCEYFALEGIAELLSTLDPRARGAQSVARTRGRAADDVRRPHESRPAGRAQISVSTSATASTRRSFRATSGSAKRRVMACQ